jgi:hypothetical protein
VIRDFVADDLQRVREIFEQRRYNFELPDMDNPLVLARKVSTDEQGIVRLAAFARMQVNAYLLVDGDWNTPRGRLDAIGPLQEAMIERCRYFGIDEASAQVSPRFARRLKDFGWRPALGGTVYKSL